MTAKANKRVIITIGRQFGCGGREIAHEIGKRLGINVYDGELLSKVAHECGLCKEFLQERDEVHNGFSWKSLLPHNSDDFTSDSEIFRIQSEVILKIAQEESAIIVGRCSNYILRNEENVLNIFLTSPFEKRAESIAHRLNMSLEQARNEVTRRERIRKDYYDHFTFGNWGKASEYDLSVDSTILGVEGTSSLIIDFAKQGGYID